MSQTGPKYESVHVVLPNKDHGSEEKSSWSDVGFTPDAFSYYTQTKRKVRSFLDNTGFQIAMLILLLYVIFVNNIATLLHAPDSSIGPINVTLVISLVIFSLELIANAWSLSKRDFLYLFLEVLGTLSILLEITWVANKILPDGSVKTGNVSRTAIITSRAGRVTRLIRLMRFVRALKIFMLMRRYFARKVDSNEKQESMAPSSMGNTLADKISVLVAFLVMMTMMFVLLLQGSEITVSPQAMLNTVSHIKNANVESLEIVVEDFRMAINEANGKARAMILQLGSTTWDWTNDDYSFTDKANDRVEYIGEEDDTILVLDISKQNKDEALLDMMLGLVIIFELCIFVAILHLNTSRILVAPLERIFNTIQTNASQIMNALEETEEDVGGNERSEIDTIEAAINKMSKLVAHVTSSGTQGAHVVKDYMKNEHASDDTKAWLKDFLTPATKSLELNGQERRPSVQGSQGGIERTKTIDRMKSGVLDVNEDGISEIIILMAKVDIDLLSSWDWDVLERSTKELMASICIMFEDLDIGAFESDMGIDTKDHDMPLVFIEVLWKFLEKVRNYYQDVPYHNFYHCVDVTHTTYRFIALTSERTSMTKIEKFAVMIAALCHDMDHPGFSNSFLVNTKHELARVYNDNSVLENRHISCLYTLVAENEDANIFSLLADTSWKEVRRIIIECILHTDMVHHFPMVSKIEVFYELHGASIKSGNFGNIFSNSEDRLFLHSLLLHCSDISNPVKPMAIAEKWANNVLGEFFRQGDLEKENNLTVSPLCNRDTTSRALSQINFIEFIVAPLYSHVARIFPEILSTIHNLRDNRKFWHEELLKEIDSNHNGASNDTNEEKRKASQRLQSFLQKYKDIFEMDTKKATKRSSYFQSNTEKNGLTLDVRSSCE